MAGPVHGLLLRPLLLAVCCLLLLHVVECSRTSPSSPADHDDHALHHHKLLMLDAEARTARRPPTSTEEVAGDRRTGADDAAPSLSTSATPVRAVGTVVVASSWPRQTSDRALARAGMLLRSKLARRVLASGAGVDAAGGSATDGTGPSCHSYNPHTSCPPASKP